MEKNNMFTVEQAKQLKHANNDLIKELANQMRFCKRFNWNPLEYMVFEFGSGDFTFANKRK